MHDFMRVGEPNEPERRGSFLIVHQTEVFCTTQGYQLVGMG
jgi:hypothetical protein